METSNRDDVMAALAVITLGEESERFHDHSKQCR